MKDFIYYIYEGNELIAGFRHISMVVNFVEECLYYTQKEVNLVDGYSGEVIDTWANGRWENE